MTPYGCETGNYGMPEPDWRKYAEQVEVWAQVRGNALRDIRALVEPGSDVSKLAGRALCLGPLNPMDALLNRVVPLYASPVAPAWQGIETAPKDGTPILSPTADGIGIIVWMSATEMHGPALFEGEEEYHDAPRWWESFGAPLDDDPTHWMPLPVVPGAMPPTAHGHEGSPRPLLHERDDASVTVTLDGREIEGYDVGGRPSPPGTWRRANPPRKPWRRGPSGLTST